MSDQTPEPRASFERSVELLSDPDVLAGKYLPQAEQDEYQRCVQSVIDARRYAAAHAHEIWIG